MTADIDTTTTSGGAEGPSRRSVLKLGAATAVVAVPLPAGASTPDPLVEMERELLYLDREYHRLSDLDNAYPREYEDECTEVFVKTMDLDREVALIVPTSLEGLAVQQRRLLRHLLIVDGSEMENSRFVYAGLLFLSDLLGSDQMLVYPEFDGELAQLAEEVRS